jgi:hypothetical protein
VSVFAEVRDLFEMKPDGSGFQVKRRLNTLINLPELAQLWRTVLNVRMHGRSAGLAAPDTRDGQANRRVGAVLQGVSATNSAIGWAGRLDQERRGRSTNR